MHTHTHLTARCVGLLKVKNSCRIVIISDLCLSSHHHSKTPQTYNLKRSRHFSMYLSGTFSQYSPGGVVDSCLLNKNHFFYDKTFDTSTSRPCQVRVKLTLVFTSVISVPPFYLFYFLIFVICFIAHTISSSRLCSQIQKRLQGNR